MNLKIDETIRDLIPPLTVDEYERLETSLLLEGCRDKLVTWRDILLDCHNRHEICVTNNIPFDTMEKDLPNKEAAMSWVINNQLGRRNLTREKFNYLIGQLYNKTKKQGARSDLTSPQNGGKSTSEVIHDQYKVGKNTVERAGVFAEAVDTLSVSLGPEVRKEILNRDVDITQKDVIQLSNVASQEVQAEVYSKIKDKGSSSVKSLVDELTIPLMISKPRLDYTDRPLLKGDNVKIEIRDCIAALDEMEDESVDCIVTDPPYGINFSTSRYRNREFEVMEGDTDIGVAIEAIKRFGRILRQNSHAYVFTRWNVYPMFFESIPKELEITNLLVWDKGPTGRGMGDLNSYAPRYELVMVLEKGERPINKPRSSNLLVFKDIRFTTEEKHHPTQKPVDLIKFLIEKSSNKGLDFYIIRLAPFLKLLSEGKLRHTDPIPNKDKYGVPDGSSAIYFKKSQFPFDLFYRSLKSGQLTLHDWAGRVEQSD